MFTFERFLFIVILRDFDPAGCTVMATMTLRNVSKSFGSVDVIHGVDLDISDGEFVILVGPSGCGKSTLLRMIAGLEDVSAGDIAIDGQVITDVPPKDRDIAMVFQSYALYPHMTVAQNMGYSLKLAKMPKTEIDRVVRETAGPLGLTDLLDRYPRELSGGQRQRVATGRAIVRSPKVFLFDEPLSNLDAKLRVQMRSEIRDLQQRLGVTSVYVTHDQVEAMTMADRIVVLRDGYIEQVGAPLDLYDHPTNLFVATFIGSPAMNLFEGVATSDGITLSDGFTLPAHSGASGAITVGLRPDALELATPEAPGAFAVTANGYEATGNETMILAEREGRAITIVTKERPEIQRGDTIWLEPNLNALHLFDGEGNRIG